MDQEKIGGLIRTLRQEQGLTQRQLAQQMHISDKAVSKWERGQGCPDLSLLPGLSNLLGVDMERLLSGELNVNEILGGNMKKLNFYVCPTCGNTVTSLAEAGVTCCGKKLQPLQAKKAEGEERLNLEIVEDEYYLTTGHPMEREHYIAWVALLSGDSLILRRLYPEWEMQARLPMLPHGRLYWYCSKHGLFWQETRRGKGE